MAFFTGVEAHAAKRPVILMMLVRWI